LEYAMPSVWYIARDGEVAGPVSQAEFAEFLRRGHLRPTDLIWHDGLDDWASGADLLAQLEHDVEPAPARPRDRGLRGAAVASTEGVSEWISMSPHAASVERQLPADMRERGT
jgi:hypothetical protein